MGRRLSNLAPLTGAQEHDEPDFAAVSRLGFPVISDMLNQWTTPIGSAVFATPPGCREGGFIGEGLFA